MKAKKYRFDGDGKFNIRNLPTNSKEDDVEKAEIVAQFEENLKKMSEMHDCFYADGKEGIIVVLQAIDAAGKDSTIKRVMNGLNPAGVYVHSFKVPNQEEAKHDYLWRFNKALPRRGEIAIFNRSYYEDVLTVRIHEFWKTSNLPERCIDMSEDDFFDKRYRQIRNYEKYLTENGYRIVKILLNVSPEVQKERFLERIDREEKNWKFSSSDLKERQLFPQYLKQFSKTINETATSSCPWYVLPADQKWYTRYLVSEIILDTFKKCDSKYPEMSEEEKARLQDCKAALLAEE